MIGNEPEIGINVAVQLVWYQISALSLLSAWGALSSTSFVCKTSITVTILRAGGKVNYGPIISDAWSLGTVGVDLGPWPLTL